MLYVFHVDTGTMLTFDMNLAMESVTTLQSAIARDCHISEDKQVLLISGGETLDPTALVGKYHAGTDTNPIFLFSKTTIEAMTPPSPSVHYGSDVDIQSQVEGSLLLPPTYATVVSRAQLSLQINDVDREEIKACEKLVHDQHLQQQGWAAVVANLEDITCALKHRFEIFTQAYDEYLLQRTGYRSTLTSIITSLQLLSKIPVLPCLLSETSSVLSAKSSSSKSSSSTTSSDKAKSLYDWISSQDPQHNLNDMVDQCVKATDQLDQNVKETLTTEVADTFKQVDNVSMKEVKGLEDRLYTLDQLMSGARKIVLEQSDMSQGFVQNQNRVSNLRDKSILPDLCSSHRKQLQVMVSNHKKLREIKKKCKMAKEELAVNLHTRLRWVMLVEKMICDVDGKLMIYHENLKRLRKRLDILRQIHEAPRVYAQLVVEVVRRRKFAQQFTEWSSSLSEDFKVVHSDELKRRKTFNSEVGHHFLQTLFQGFEDTPPTVFTEPVADFDRKLPQITRDDIDMLKEVVPELACDLDDPIEATFQILAADMCRGKAHFKPSSLVASEIEIIKSMDEHFLNTEKTSLSLGEQVADSELDANIVIQGEIGSKNMDSIKPDLIMPRSLSEDLTKQMKQEEKRKSCDVDVVDSELKTVDVKKSQSDTQTLPTSQKSSAEASSSSGEQVKSTESDLSGHENTQHSADEKVIETGGIGRRIVGRPRTASGLSPDMETSQEFTTADFYIEDSMPSSIADSPPTCEKRTEEKPSAEKLMEDEATITEKLEKELLEYKQKYSATVSKLESVQEYVNIHLPEIRSQLKLLESSYTSNQSEFREDFKSGMKKISEALCSYDLQRIEENKCSVEKRFEDTERNRKTLEESSQKLSDRIKELELENANLQKAFELAKEDLNTIKKSLEQKEQSIKVELEKTRSGFQGNLTEANEKIKALEMEKTDLQKEIQLNREKLKAIATENDANTLAAKEKYESELADLRKQHSLELEVELDKLRAELKDQIEELETSLQEKEKALSATKKGLTKEKTLLEEHLREIFQKEKDDITRIMEEDFEEKMKTHLNEERDKLEKKHKDEMEAACNKNKAELEETKHKMNETKDEEFIHLKMETERKFLKMMEEKEEMFSKDKEAAVQSQADRMKEEHRQECEALKQELSQERDRLQQELKTFKERELSQQESQTEDIDTKHRQQQTELIGVTTGETQTPQLQVTVGESQTDKKEHTQKDIQTDKIAGKNIQSQTDKLEVKQGESQTKILTFAQGEVQTDVKELAQKEAQTKIIDLTQGESQTEAVQRSVEDTGDLTTNKEHQRLMADLQAKLLEEYSKTKEQELNSARQQFEEEKQQLSAQHDKEISELIAKLEKDKEDSLGSLKTSMTAEKQVMFNEAVNKVSQEKDKIIESLRQKEEELLKQQKLDKEALDKVMEEKSKAEDLKTRAMSHLSDKEREFSASRRQFESEMALVKQQLSEYQQQIQSMSHMAVSATPSVMNISTTEDKDSKITVLEGEVKTKNEEIINLQQKLNDLAMSASTRSVVQDKVSITSCSVGDLVLFCLDERHDQYVVFTIGTTLHFLHTDCLECLGLRTNPGDAKKSWVLAEIVEKEYCQAKKPQNRFKVQVGTKFFRVKAKPWSRSRDAQAPVPQPLMSKKQPET